MCPHHNVTVCTFSKLGHAKKLQKNGHFLAMQLDLPTAFRRLSAESWEDDISGFYERGAGLNGN